MLQLLTVHLAVALVGPVLVRLWGRRMFAVLALAPLSATVWALAQTPAVMAGDAPVVTTSWVPALGIDLSFRLDVLGWFMVLIVGGVGALVLLYCAWYFASGASNLPRFAGVFVAFAGAMLGLVTTDNTFALYAFWELTTVFSYLLIGHYFDRKVSRRAAMQAIIVTTFGGLVMLAGLVMLGELPGGSYSLTELVASAPESPLLPIAIVCVLVGAVSKSALVPFHFWLPSAMAAPTPVSAYLHAAAMVKAGVYLVARLAPGYSTLPAWQWTLLVLASATMILGGYRALRQHDLKLLLAYGTVSQLGFLILLVGQPSRAVALAGLALLGAHAMFKAALFLSVGIVDAAAGTRDLRQLSGLVRTQPFLAVVAGLATASMIGLPPFAGYVAKEAALEGFVHDGDPTSIMLLAVVVLGSILTVAYGLRFWWGAFGIKKDLADTEVDREAWPMFAAPTVLAVAGLAAGLVPALGERLLEPFADTYPTGDPGHLTLWGGFGWPVVLTLAVFVLGALLFVARTRVEAAQGRVELVLDADVAYRQTMRRLDRASAYITSFTQRGSLPMYLSIILLTGVVVGGWAALSSGRTPGPVRPWDTPVQLVVGVIVILGAILAARSRRRMKAVLLLGACGYGVAVLFELQGAPDLALTQVLVETITLVVFVLVLRRLPPYFSNRPLAASRWWRAALGVLVGAFFAFLALIIPTARIEAPISVYFPAEAYEYGYGKNIVNVTLVDIRAWDTMGEISVLLVAATGVASLVFRRLRGGRIERARDVASSDLGGVWAGEESGRLMQQIARLRGSDAPAAEGQRNRQWLTAGATLAPERRSVIFEITTRLVFHTMIVFSVFLLFSGHNAPGGGFAAGLVAGIALVVRYLAGGRYELAEAAPINPGLLLGSGLFLSAGAGLVPVLFGGQVLQSAVLDVDLGPLGELHGSTALFFDIGVYLVVIGLALDVLRTLGAEIDRQGETEGSAAPDVAYDADDDGDSALAGAPAGTNTTRDDGGAT
ncbi:NADH dehydrogenase (quinone) [Beutenbergia cavernae DSM 12333]|uniref:NADH dehydrogenase (Quinone) n=1 Tax=Beutenbergia cavernae (strain ATCC BAA-8 / DSM 12333 / CCUG 43141 / JCM 11478 / NBRC 16432 / NCIMB 13614 / HKI 0122) TaxID=471853 RepID=C5C4D6_BEUC1|nr:Na+/H+ antiporter subunit A [Beutenbergia cavernae]ACQ82060.1 NADH dehydrogenase (quinone) [Beutenbergia cavernae DSM 12333]